MESWQAAYIVNNRSQLIQETDCSTAFISELTAKDILGDADTDKLNLYQDNHEKAAYLYAILPERQFSFDQLAKALHDTKQFAALHIILSGYAANEILPPVGLPPSACDKWADLPEARQEEILHTPVNFLGVSTKLSAIFARFSTSKDEQSKLLNESLNGEVLVNLQYHNTNSLVILARDDIPQDKAYYIPRTIVKHVRINPDAFSPSLNKDEQDDIFVFEGVEKAELEMVVQQEVRYFSQVQEAQPLLPVKYIIVEEPTDFEAVCMSLYQPGKNVHSVKYSVDKQTYFWERSKGNPETVRKLLLLAAEHQVVVHESAFIFDCNVGQSSLPVLICDSPGSGKSILLANIAQEMKHVGKNTVLFFNLRALLNHVCFIEEKLTVENIKAVISNLKSESLFGQRVLFQYLMSEWVHVKLFLDGFDEIPFLQVALAIKFIQVILQDWKNCQLFITSRSSDCQILERILQVPSCSIAPLTDAEQVKLLVKYWSRDIANVSFDVLTAIAKNRLKTVETYFTHFERGLVEKPLQCRLLAELYKSSAVWCSREPQLIISHPNFKISSVFQLYKEFITARFSRIDYAKERDLSAEMKAVRLSPLSWKPNKHSLSFKEQYYLAHVRAAFQTIFPEHVAMFDGVTGELEQVKMESVYAIGLIKRESVDWNSVQFYHNTVAEYLIADFIAGCVNNEFDQFKIPKGNILRFLLNILLVSKNTETCYPLKKLDFPNFATFSLKAYIFAHSAICYFLNCQLTDRQFSRNGWKNFCKFLQLNRKHNNNCVSNLRQCFEILVSSLFDNYQNIFHICRLLLLKEEIYTIDKMSAKVQIKAGAFKFFWSDRHPNWGDMLYPAAMCVHAGLFKSCADFTQILDKYQSEDEQVVLENYLCSRSSSGCVKPIHLAVHLGNFHVVEDILKRALESSVSLLTFKNLLHVCVQNSEADGDQVVKEKTQIIRLFCKFEKGLLNEPCDGSNGLPPILMKNVHPELVKYLIEQGARVFAACVECNATVHKALAALSRECYRKIAQALVEEGHKEILLAQAKGDQAFLSASDGDDNDNQGRLNEVGLGLHKCALLHFATKVISEPEFVEVLIQLGCDINALDAAGCTPLWYAKRLSSVLLGSKKEEIIDTLHWAGGIEYADDDYLK